MHGDAFLFIGTPDERGFVNAFLSEHSDSRMASYYNCRDHRMHFITDLSVVAKTVILEAESHQKLKKLADCSIDDTVLACCMEQDTRQFLLSNGGKHCLEELNVSVIDIGKMKIITK